jgi:hypothetical protein
MYRLPFMVDVEPRPLVATTTPLRHTVVRDPRPGRISLTPGTVALVALVFLQRFRQFAFHSSFPLDGRGTPMKAGTGSLRPGSPSQ